MGAFLKFHFIHSLTRFHSIPFSLSLHHSVFSRHAASRRASSCTVHYILYRYIRSNHLHVGVFPLCRRLPIFKITYCYWETIASAIASLFSISHLMSILCCTLVRTIQTCTLGRIDVRVGSHSDIPPHLSIDSFVTNVQSLVSAVSSTSRIKQ